MSDHDPNWERPRPRPSAQPVAPLTQTESDRLDDMMWCLGNRETVLAHLGQVVAVHNRRVWGAGPDHNAAWQDARSKAGCPPWEEFAFVPMPETLVYDPIGDLLALQSGTVEATK